MHPGVTLPAFGSNGATLSSRGTDWGPCSAVRGTATRTETHSPSAHSVTKTAQYDDPAAPCTRPLVGDTKAVGCTPSQRSGRRQHCRRGHVPEPECGRVRPWAPDVVMEPAVRPTMFGTGPGWNAAIKCSGLTGCGCVHLNAVGGSSLCALDCCEGFSQWLIRSWGH